MLNVLSLLRPLRITSRCDSPKSTEGKEVEYSHPILVDKIEASKVSTAASVIILDEGLIPDLLNASINI